MDKKYSIQKFKAKIKPIEKINNEFTRCKVYAFGIGKNRNFSHVSKENMERNKSTLSYVPVVGHIVEKYDQNGNKIGVYMGSHDYKVADTLEYKSLCVPYGVVIENSFDYENIKEYGDNKEREYLICEAILWTGRYPELNEAIYSEDIFFNESAELIVEECRPLEEDSNYLDIVDFTFSALCLLGKADDNSTNGHTDKLEHTEPCFVESKVVPIQYSLQQEYFSKILGEMKKELTFYFNMYSNGKEGKVMEDTKNIDDNNKKEVEKTVVVETDNSQKENVIDKNIINNTNDVNVDNEKNKNSDTNDKFTLLKMEYEEYKRTHSHTNEEFNKLQKYYDDTEYTKLHSQKEKILSNEKYSVLSDNVSFIELKKNMDNYSLTDLEKEVKVIFADYVVSISDFSLQVPVENKLNSIKLFGNPNTRKNGKSGRYGDIFKK